MPHSQARALRGLLLSVAMIGLCGGEAAALVVLDDGGTHLINGPSDAVWVHDSLAGGTTILTIDNPAHLGTHGTLDLSVRAAGSHGGKGVVKILGGTLDGLVEASGGSCVTIAGGSIGKGQWGQSLNAHSVSDLAIVGIDGGTFAGSLWVEDSCRVTVNAGTFGEDDSQRSLTVSGEVGTSIVDVYGGTFDGRLRAYGDCRVGVSDSSFGRDSSFVSAWTNAPSGSKATLGITQSTLSGILLVGSRSEVSISNSLLGHVNLGPSVKAEVTDWGTAVVDVPSGTFPGGLWASSGGRVRIGGGSFGFMGPPSALASVVALVDVDDLPIPTVVQIFGGAFDKKLRAGRCGTIHVYGHNLNISGTSNLLTGTLASGAPINVPTSTEYDGKIFLHEVTEIPAIPPGFSLMQDPGLGMSTLWLPTDLLPPPPDCPLGAIPVALTGVPLGIVSLGGRAVDAGAASAIIQRTAAATNPGRGAYQDTIPIELLALQLTSAEPMDLTPLGGLGTDHLFLTLQGDRGGHLLDPLTSLASTGEMTIDFAMRTFDSSLEVFFDVRAGSPDGPILFSGNDTLVATQVPWAVDLPEGLLAIPGIDDAFFAGVIGGSLVGFDQDSQLLQFRVTTALVPEPATLALLAVGGLLLIRRRAAVAHATRR